MQKQQAAERAAARERAAAQAQRRQTRPLSAEHARAVQQLKQCRTEREQLRTDRETLHRSLRQSRQELAALPRWARSRRHALTDTITSSEQELQQTAPTLGTLDAEIDRLTRQVAHHTRQRLASDLSATHRDRPDRWDLTRSGDLAQPRPAPISGLELSSLLAGQEPYRGAERDLGDGLSL